MVGVSLIHGGLGIPLLLALWGGLFWIAAVVIFAALSRSFASVPTRILVVLYGLAWVLVETPYGFWQRLLVEKLAHGAHAPEFLSYAAALGDLQTVEAFLSQGVPVDARNREGSTALHGAAVEGQLTAADYLLARGADMNAVNRYGETAPTCRGFSQRRAAREFAEAKNNATKPRKILCANKWKSGRERSQSDAQPQGRGERARAARGARCEHYIGA